MEGVELTLSASLSGTSSSGDAQDVPVRSNLVDPK